MQIDQVRKIFIEFFKEKGHTEVASSSLVPAGDPSLLFTNAGMVQFKEVFLGSQVRAYQSAVSSQRCLRAGGKHNDLENVGFTARHHTFFEMLGNFSFGAYFKEKAILYAWELITERYHLDPKRLYVTVYHNDEEAYQIWTQQVGVQAERVIKIDTNDNFWSMGDTGPCGPCTEIFYDLGPDVPGGLPGTPEEDGDRYMEIWNLVFMQYNRLDNGDLEPLPRPAVDTGMGLERMSAVLQGVRNNFDIDLFAKLIAQINRIIGDKAKPVALRVIADHLRAICFLIADQVYPSNEGRGYVLRRIMRRAMRFGYQSGVRQPFLHRLVPLVIELMRDVMVEDEKILSQIPGLVEREEKLFFKTLDQGCEMVEKHLVNHQQISGEVAFKLYDTYGFPLDLLKDMALERGVSVDVSAFEELLIEAKSRSKQGSAFNDMKKNSNLSQVSAFIGYDCLESQATVTCILDVNEAELEALHAGQQGMIVVPETPFYPEGGGQIGDQGCISIGDDHLFVVHDTQRVNDCIVHIGEVQRGIFSSGALVTLSVGAQRQSTVKHHSATHLLHSALRQVLGEHVVQRGSLVNDQRLRFDFSHFQALTAHEVMEVEQLVNQAIQSNWPAHSQLMALDEAKKQGVIALFDEKYASDVRVMSFGEFSKELCGGTHVARTGDIGCFVITAQSSAASGVRRLEALAGVPAVAYMQSQRQKIDELSQILRTSPNELTAKVTQMQTKLKDMAKGKDAQVDVASVFKGRQRIGDIDVVFKFVPGMQAGQMRGLCDQLRELSQSLLVFLVNAEPAGGFIVCASQTLSKQLDLKAMVGALDEQTGLSCRGGGSPHLLQGKVGGKVTAIETAFTEWVHAQLEK